MTTVNFNDYVQLTTETLSFDRNGEISEYPVGTICLIVGFCENEKKEIETYYARPLSHIINTESDIGLIEGDFVPYNVPFTWDDSKTDSDIYEKGIVLCVLDSSKYHISLFVKNVSIQTNHKLDWNYYGGRAVVYVMPEDREDVYNYIKLHEKELFEGFGYEIR